MEFTQVQKDTIKADILANADLKDAYDNGNLQGLADLYNAETAHIVWRSNVSIDEIMNNGFVWTAVDQLTVGKARIWDWMSRLGHINPSKANIRQGVADCFGAGSAMVNGILPHCKRGTTRLEKLFATGTGTDAAPATMALEGKAAWTDFVGI